MNQGRRHVLLVAQDNFLAHSSEVHVDWLAILGNSITPLSPPPPRLDGARFLSVLGSLFRRRYAAVILPAIQFSWPHDSNALKRAVRKTLAWLAGRGVLMKWLRAVVFGSQPVFIIDRYDSAEMDAVFYRAVEPSAYFKTNLPVAVAAKDSGLHYLPYWLHVSRYPQLGSREKKYDVAFAASINSEARRLALGEIKKLRASGLRVYVAESALSTEAYMELLASSLLVVSPEGCGYHSFRHFEVMLAGSVPVINEAVPPVVTDLVNGTNCFLYEGTTPGNLFEVAQRALANPEHLISMGQALHRYAIERHSLEAIGELLLARIPEPARVPSSNASQHP